MRKQLIAVLVAVLAVACLSTLVIPTFAQVMPPPTNTTATPPPPWMRWMRFRGAVTEWGSQSYHGTITLTSRIGNVTLAQFRPWATVDVVWSNEKLPFSSETKPVGQVTYTHYAARLVQLLAVRGKQADPNYNLNVTGLWNVTKVKITSEFDENGVLLKSTREFTPILNKAKGQLHITEDWKKFDVAIEGIDVVNGKGFLMNTAINMINPFSFTGAPKPVVGDLVQLVKCYRAMPGFGNYLPELDYNQDSKIDLADLTTVAANM